MDQRWTGGRGKRRFSYTYADLARVLNMKEPAVRQAALRGTFDPTDLADVVRYARERERRRGGN